MGLCSDPILTGAFAKTVVRRLTLPFMGVHSHPSLAGSSHEGGAGVTAAVHLCSTDQPLSGTLPGAGTLSNLPIFSRTTSNSSPAQPAESTRCSSAQSIDSTRSLSIPGPFNPAASLPNKLIKKILDLEYVDMSEMTLDAEPEQVPGRPPTPGRPPVTNISQRVERYSLMAATLVSRFPEKAAELFAYQATIIRAERNYEAGRWVLYDRQFRREALARRDLNWSVTNPCLYNEAFTGRARAVPRCSICLSDSHANQQCPQNLNQQWVGWYSSPAGWPPAVNPTTSMLGTPAQRPSNEVCRRYNEGRCRYTRCRHMHICKHCGASHPGMSCPHNRPMAPLRSRSPLRQPHPAQHQQRGPTGQH